MGLPSQGSPHMLNRRRSGRNDALAGPPHLILAGSCAAQGDEELAFSEDAHMVLWCTVGPIEVDEKAVRCDEALKLHPMIFLVSSINMSLKNAGRHIWQMVQSMKRETEEVGAPKSVSASAYLRRASGEMTPVGVDIGHGLVCDF